MYKVKPRVRVYLLGLFTKTVFDVYRGDYYTVAKLMSDGGANPYKMYLEHLVQTYNHESEALSYCKNKNINDRPRN